MDDFIIQHPQGGSGFPGARAAPGEQDGSRARVRTGPEAAVGVGRGTTEESVKQTL